ncbi:glycosyltransferase family 4 protein [Neptuniibacter sp. CAU 1671]|uniref:glycosyltransferase family 4 protein n=1 Tax=Neptuniibacter sp. CAU 1671 TaxID=3032593 RepID=UPI0023DA6AEB|nr:glycosyltransferase family 4 protein [Neptuniibacter sp. CAU 1671]MDF2181412.1 glycosyltransferase family 4 protein [Neptuniibacter sp. CAU 1671]
MKSVIEAVVAESQPVSLFVGSAGRGVLDTVEITTYRYFYHKFFNKWLVLFAYLLSQVSLFFRLCCSRCAWRSEVVYINTVLPFAAALYGRLFRKRVIYHIHEVSLSPPVLFRCLMWIADRLADQQIYVSAYQRTAVSPGCTNTVVVYNAVSRNIWDKAHMPVPVHSGFTVLMPASLREYKGVEVFLSLAKKLNPLPVKWVLLLNEEPSMVQSFRQQHSDLASLQIADSVSDPSDFYQRADIVVNLSLVEQWIETFGLTIAEAFAFGKPVIAPPVGGPVEIVDDGVDGYLIDSRDTEALVAAIIGLYESPELLEKMSLAAQRKAEKFSPDRFAAEIMRVL